MLKNISTKLSDKRYRLWFSLLIVSAIGVAIMIAAAFIDGSYKRPDWKERTIIWLYFTFMSNVSAIIVSSLVVFGVIRINSKHAQRAKTLMAVNLTVTSIIFWTVLVKDIAHYPTLTIISTIAVHAITPIFAVFVYFYEAKNSIIEDKDKSSPLITMMLNTIFPALWLVMAITVYYSMGPDSESAIYGFLDFNKNIGLSLGIIGAITVMYPSLTYGYQWICNK